MALTGKAEISLSNAYAETAGRCEAGQIRIHPDLGGLRCLAARVTFSGLRAEKVGDDFLEL